MDVKDDVREVREWKLRLNSYARLIVVEVRDEEEGDLLIEALWKPDLHVCPYSMDPHAFIFPLEAKEFLPKGVEWRVVQVRHVDLLNEKIRKEISRRFRENIEPNYYERRPRGSYPTVFKGYVTLKTARAIAKEIGVPVGCD